MSSATQPEDSITLDLGEITVPLPVVQELLRRHVLRSLRLAANGHSPTPLPDPQEEQTPAVPLAQGEPPAVPAGAP